MNEQMTMTLNKQVNESRLQGGKYLTFILEQEHYGLEILAVQEIIGMMAVTRVPRTPDYMRGVINLRGKVIPLIDLRVKFGLSATEDTKKTCIIVLQITRGGQKTTLGIVVDEVSEVVDIPQKNVQPPPEIGVNIDTRVIIGLGKVEQKVILLLDIDRVFTIEEIQNMNQHS